MDDATKDIVLKSVMEKLSDLSKKVDELQSLKNDIPTSKELIEEIKTTKHGVFKILPFKPKRRRGVGSPPILESEIREAQEKSKSAAEAAKRLNVVYKTYKKYAMMYGLHDNFLNKCGKGVYKPKNPNCGKFPLNEILAGKFPDYPLYKLKDKLIRSGLKQPCCEQCGYCERRITDNKIPLLLVFEDNNDKNHKIENIKVFCYNCSFTAGKIWVKIKDRKRWLNDPARVQGSPKDVVQKF
jgi:hypothetical protein